MTKDKNRTQTNMILTLAERQALKYASGDPFAHGAIVGGVRALLADWDARGRPVLLPARPCLTEEEL